MAADDPLAAIKKGIAGVREVEEERKKWRKEKEREMKELEEADRRRERHERKSRRRQEDDLEGFRLGPSVIDEDCRRRWRSSKDRSSRNPHPHRNPSDDRSRHHSHHGHLKSLRKDDRPGWEVGAGGRYSNQFAHV